MAETVGVVQVLKEKPWKKSCFMCAHACTHTLTHSIEENDLSIKIKGK